MSKYYLGIDVGGTKIKAVLLSGTNKQKPKSFETETPGNIVDFAKGLEAFIEKVVRGKNISGIGMALPGVVDTQNGILLGARNLPFLENWNASAFLKRFSKKVAIENDSRAFLIAEMKMGAGKGYKDTVGLTIGTGIGGGIFIDGKLYRGTNNSAGEAGHMVIQPPADTLEKLGRKDTKLNTKERSIIIGIGVANLVNILNPEVVILGGGGIVDKFVSVEEIKKTALKHICYASSKKVKILPTELGYYSSAIGAALLFK